MKLNDQNIAVSQKTLILQWESYCKKKYKRNSLEFLDENSNFKMQDYTFNYTWDFYSVE